MDWIRGRDKRHAAVYAGACTIYRNDMAVIPAQHKAAAATHRR